MKTIKCFTVTICLALLGLQACMTEEEMRSVTDRGELTAVQFTSVTGSGPATRTTNGGDNWVTGDSIGIYMAAIGDQLGSSVADNRLFRVTDASLSPSPLAPEDPTGTIYYLETGPVWFAAYYPYLEPGKGIENYIYPVNVAKQQDTTHIDLLYVRDDNGGTGYNKPAINSPVLLTFEHQLSKIVVNVKREAASAITPPLSAVINSMPAAADFNLATGALANLAAPTPIEMLTLEDHPGGYDTTFQAIVVPHDLVAGNETLVILTKLRQFTWKIPTGVLPNEKFEPGLRYTFNLTLNGDASIDFEAEISQWSEWQAPAGSSPNLLTPDTTQAATGTVYSVPVGYIAAENRYADTLQAVFINPVKPFMLGSNHPPYNAYPTTPVHKVSLTNAYLLGQTEVTNAQYVRFLNAVGATAVGTSIRVNDIHALVPLVPSGINNNALGSCVNISISDGVWTAYSPNAQKPVVNINWYGAMAYAIWAGGTLPTEAQWEYAARGGLPDGTDYIDGPTATDLTASNDGTHMDRYAWVGQIATQPVGLLAPNGYNLYDIFGNVWEWCFDRYLASVEEYPSDQPVTDPEGTSTGVRTSTLGSLRGAGYLTPIPLTNISIGIRNNSTLSNTSLNYGFRVAIPLK